MDLDIRLASMEALVSPSCQPPLLLVEASSLRAVRPSERDAAPSDTRLIWDVSVPSSASTSRDAFCWLNANAVAAVPTSAANEAEVTNADLREAALAASRMARRLIGATSFSLSTTSGASPTTAPPSASCAIRTALAVWEPRFAVNNALDRLNCACETLAALCAACLIYQSLLADCETVAAYDRARLQNRHKGKGTPT